MATAVALARRGYSVVLAARRADRLAEAARRCTAAARRAGSDAARTVVHATDVADEGQVNALVSAAAAQFGRIDVMVNNAGVGTFNRVHETSDEEMRWIFDVNYFGAFYGCRAVAPIMIRQRSGHIFNLSSVIGKRGTPFQGAYCATKFALCGLTDALRVEMAPYGVRVTCVCPALTDTEFKEHTRHGQIDSSSRRALPRMPAAGVAERIAKTVGKNKPELVFTLSGRALVVLSTLWPRAVDALMKAYHDELIGNLAPSPAAGERAPKPDACAPAAPRADIRREQVGTSRSSD